MHTVTKVLVVFAAVLCVLLSALTMAYSVNADRIVADYKNQVQARLGAEENAKADITAARLEVAEKLKDHDALARQNTDQATTIHALESDRAQLITKLAAAESGRDSTSAQISQLAATGKTQALLIDSYRSEVTKLRESELKFQHDKIELVDRINDLESQREVQDQNIRALQEKMAEMKRTIDSQGTAVTMTSGGTPSGPYKPSIPISGKIVATQKSGNGKTFATIKWCSA